MDQENQLRYLSKTFRCNICNTIFKKLVHINESATSCANCGHQHCYETISNEFNRENIDRTYRLNFSQASPGNYGQYHNQTDVYDRNITNVYGDSVRERRGSHSQSNQGHNHQFNSIPNNSTTQQQARANNPNPPRSNNPRQSNLLHMFFIPFSVSPFAGSVNRSPFNFSWFNNFLHDDYFENPTHDFFMDNFSSNFTSNFIDPMTRIVFITTMRDQNQHAGNPPASRVAKEKLKTFKMSKEHCKKDPNDESKVEYPTCSICWVDLNEGEDTILLPCGHMFHNQCINKWWEIHNSCPVCRFELPTDDPIYERDRARRNQERNQNIEQSSRVQHMNFNQQANPHGSDYAFESGW